MKREKERERGGGRERESTKLVDSEVKPCHALNLNSRHAEQWQKIHPLVFFVEEENQKKLLQFSYFLFSTMTNFNLTIEEKK
jgi:hypothetical protein